MQEINLYDLLKYYARNWLLLLSAVFVGAIIGLTYTNFIQTPLYKSDATMLVVGARTSQDATINNNYTELFKSRRVLETVIEGQGYNGNYEQLLARTTATNDKNTDIIKVSIADPDGRKSETLLQASLEAFKKEAGALYNSNNIKTVDAASTPATPYNVNVLLQVGLATVAAFFVAVIALFFVYDYQSTAGAVTAKPAAKPTKKKPAAQSRATATKKGAKSNTAKKTIKSAPARTSRTPFLKNISNLLVGSIYTVPATPKQVSKKSK